LANKTDQYLKYNKSKMPTEIERKFLVKHTDFIAGCPCTQVIQGYIAASSDCTVRVRLKGNKAFLTLKGKTTGATRSEFEYDIPFREAEEMINSLCLKPLIQKTRYYVDHMGFTWEVDIFHGENTGLVIAELELDSENMDFPMPPWVDKEVTGDIRYHNSHLCLHPFKSWEKK
jgi:adenylate cyclase